MTCSTRIEYVLHTNIMLPDGSSYLLRQVFDNLTKTRDVAAWYKRNGGTYVTITQVNIAETFTPIDVQ